MYSQNSPVLLSQTCNQTRQALSKKQGKVTSEASILPQSPHHAIFTIVRLEPNLVKM